MNKNLPSTRGRLARLPLPKGAGDALHQVELFELAGLTRSPCQRRETVGFHRAGSKFREFRNLPGQIEGLVK